MDRSTAVETALRAGAPHTLLEIVKTAMAEQYGADRVELRLADYAMRSLQVVAPAPSAGSVPIHDSPQGRVFGTQEPLVVRDGATGRADVHLPVTIRGDRMGVLTVGMPQDRLGGSVLPELQNICEALGHEILVADRDTDLYVLARRAARLTLAAEMQWQLLPGRACFRAEFSLGAHLEPAYAVLGDNYDWSVSADALTLTITNGMGQGIDAALLSNLTVNALRNARRAGLDLAGQAALADQAVYAQHQGRVHVSVLLLRFTLATGQVEVIEAGSPQAWRMSRGVVTPLAFDAQLPLGMFEDTEYVPEYFTVREGDRLLFASDGVYEAQSSAGERYGDRALARSLAATRLLPAPQVPDAVLRELRTYHGDVPLDDDALVVCLDWHGPSAGNAGPQGPR
ncbi:PP2C family protein-serine/threonine phosphatase [Streptomyces sp. NPDC051310]|uniref:PP2C family protein-serine/threonine phosphatase n=1 Tax=Streptomyces sp. NPDC051310 TaxID=3365649 RepID=UPI0037B6643E